MSIFAKINTLITGTVICLVAVLGLMGYWLISSSGNENASKMLNVAQRAMQGDLDELTETQRLIATAIETDAGLAKVLAEKDTAALQRLAKQYVDEPIIDFFTAVDMSGTVLVRGHSNTKGDVLGSNLASGNIPLKQGRTAIGLETGQDFPLTLSAGVPIRYNGAQVGAIILGINLSSGEFVKAVKDKLDVESTIFADDVRATTTVMRDGRPVINTKLNNNDIYSAVIQRGETTFSRNLIAGSQYDTIYWPWKDISGKIGGILFVGISRDIIVSAQQKVILYFLLGGVGIGAVMIILGSLFARALSRPIRQATSFAEEVAAGNFNGTLNITSKDEVGVLSRSLGEMVTTLKQKIAESEERSREAADQAEKANAAMSEAQAAKEAAEEGQRAILQAAERVEKVVTNLLTSASELDAQVASSSTSAETQREQVTSCATAMDEMNSTVLEVARNAAVAADGSANAKEKAQSGAEIAKSSVQAIDRVREETTRLRQAMDELGKEADGIGEVITVINDIADQTNLLALNAAIEAARAGEAGRGFAVVADEVRKLAEKTVTATKEVSTVISSIQQGTRRSIESVDRTGSHLESAVELVNKSGQALSEIVDESVATADQVQGIATAAEEQSATSEEIARSLEHINTSASETASLMHQSATAVNDLSTQVHLLQDLVQELRHSS